MSGSKFVTFALNKGKNLTGNVSEKIDLRGLSIIITIIFKYFFL